MEHLEIKTGEEFKGLYTYLDMCQLPASKAEFAKLEWMEGTSSATYEFVISKLELQDESVTDDFYLIDHSEVGPNYDGLITLWRDVEILRYVEHYVPVRQEPF